MSLSNNKVFRIDEALLLNLSLTQPTIGIMAMLTMKKNIPTQLVFYLFY